jgi:hypothetical protein
MTVNRILNNIDGFGLGLRHEHFLDVIETKPKLDWLEVITENFMMPGGNAVNSLKKIRALYPILFHGVSLSIGSSDPLNYSYLNKLKETIKLFEPTWISDHLCWTGIHSKNTHDLLPMPYTEESLKHIVSRLIEVQDFLGHAILIENPSSYVSFEESSMSESVFLKRMAQESGCYLLLDVNNVYVSSINHGFSAFDYIAGLPQDKIKQIHLAGHTNKGDVLIDTHDSPLIEPVLSLYKKTIELKGFVPTMIERDDNIPSLAELMKELDAVKEIVISVKSNPKAVA